MGRNKLSEEGKRCIVAVNVPIDIYTSFEKLNIKNKSRLFNFLLEEYFNKMSYRRNIEEIQTEEC